MTTRPALPEPLPAEPFSLLADWLAEARARGATPNPDAMVLATCDTSGRPSARVVLCKDIEPGVGVVRFVTNYLSRKGRELAANPRAALVFHWDHLNRQARIEGTVRKADARQSDRYFSSRARDSQLGAHASQQSEPVESRAALRARLDAVRAQFGEAGEVPRPSHWGIYEVWADAVELWVEGSARLHDRARWTRPTNSPVDTWSATRLQP